jgi:hypothetical protein
MLLCVKGERFRLLRLLCGEMDAGKLKALAMSKFDPYGQVAESEPVVHQICGY